MSEGLRRWLPRIVIGGVGIALVGVVGLVGLGAALHEPLPTGETGPAAEALADRMLQAVDAEAWERTGAVSFRFHTHEHLWDLRRNLARVRDGDVEVLVDLSDRTGLARRGGAPVASDEQARLVAWAYATWANDSFWLNPVVKVRDPGTTRSLVRRDGADALLVSYSSGGVTPGDSYLWHLGPDGRPTRWEMWVGILPIGGLDVSWEGWKTLSTGASVSTVHDWGFVTLEVGEVRAAESLDALGEAGAFEGLSGG